ncbi:MAG: alpha/beta hydrolase [Candidatus Nanoarchaeia archaeon]|nr:alpha/beta hydrolase [Candidatus Nanoarchaeia archaeon]
MKDNTKKIYMVHCWESNSEENWYPWLKYKLEERGLDVFVFNMPNTKHPKIEEWVKYLEANVKDIDESTYFIGHSIGCQTILRFLEKLHKNKKIGGCIFVAPWFNLINLEPNEMEIAHPWLNTQIHFGRVSEHCNRFLAIFSSDDPYVPLSDKEIFRDKLNAKIILGKNRGHFEQVIEPEILKETLNFLKIR